MFLIKEEKIPIKIWVDTIEPEAEKQARNLANLPHAFHHIAVMPDVHVGYGMPIGGVLATKGVIIPNAVGVDIGCGMVTVKTSLSRISQKQIKIIIEKLKKVIPVGFNHHKKPQKWDGFNQAPHIPIIQKELNSAKKQIGTLGGGNHFAEILQETEDKNKNLSAEGNIWLMIHSGSRNFGFKTASVYHRKAKKYCQKEGIDLPHSDLAFLPLESRDGKEYWQAMNYCREFAAANRYLMMERFMDVVVKVTGAEFLPFKANKTKQVRKGRPYFGIHHNFASRENHFGEEVVVHRKGATQAFLNQLGIIPGSMGAPSYITKGLGNPESFKSSAHGAGRVMSRKKANKTLTKEEANNAIQGVYLPSWKGKFDEAPQVYKNIEEVIERQKDLAKPLKKLTPLAVMIGN